MTHITASVALIQKQHEMHTVTTSYFASVCLFAAWTTQKLWIFTDFFGRACIYGYTQREFQLFSLCSRRISVRYRTAGSIIAGTSWCCTGTRNILGSVRQTRIHDYRICFNRSPRLVVERCLRSGHVLEELRPAAAAAGVVGCSSCC